jgi:hypothetical protein
MRGSLGFQPSGKSFHVVKAQVCAHRGGEKALVAKLNATLAGVAGQGPA